jgi:hypothetical protein
MLVIAEYAITVIDHNAVTAGSVRALRRSTQLPVFIIITVAGLIVDYVYHLTRAGGIDIFAPASLDVDCPVLMVAAAAWAFAQVRTADEMAAPEGNQFGAL